MPGESLILLVDDDEAVLEAMGAIIAAAGLGRVEALSDPRRVLPYLESRAPSVLVLDHLMPHLSGFEILGRVVERWPDVPVILSTSHVDTGFAVECMKGGAFDFIPKGSSPARLIASIRHALQLGELKSDYKFLKDSMLPGAEGGDPSADGAFAHIVTRNEHMQNILRYVASVAPSVKPVLVTGESGTGKELVARAIHLRSGRKGAFVPVNVAATDENFFSDTFLGHSRGAFTGADKDRGGLLQSAEGGTLFLDEIGDLPMQSQVKLLRLLEADEFLPLGATKQVKFDVKFVAATNKDLKALGATKEFRHDLFYRLETHHILLPPLRKRRDDLPLLVKHFVVKACESMLRPILAVPQELFPLLEYYDFPGNVRELESMVFDAVSRARGSTLPLESFKERVFAQGGPAAGASQTATGGDEAAPNLAAMLGGMGRLPSLRDLSLALIEEAMNRAEGNQGLAAKMLGLSRTALNRRLKGMKDCEDDEGIDGV